MNNNKLSNDIAVLIPCYNEEATIKKVILDFKEVLPHAKIYVYDNDSTDETVKEASIKDVVVVKEPCKGKGVVVRRMFAEIEADTYIMVDGDMTYNAKIAPELVSKLHSQNLDMINVARVPFDKKVYKFGHGLSNWFINKFVGILFGNNFKDMLSGYKIFNKNFVKSFPATTKGFELESEITLYALMSGRTVSEYASPYYARPANSASKISLLTDGFKILFFIICTFLKKIINT